MRHPFLRDVWARLERAEHQFEEIKRELDHGFEPQNHPVQRQLNHRTRKYLWVWAENNPQYWIDLGLAFGELLHNLRSCLDHVAWAFAEVGNVPHRNRQPHRYTAFPFADSETAWEKAVKGDLRDVPLRGQAFIKHFQPCAKRNKLFNQKLRVISQLNNTDKHSLLNVIASVMRQAELKTYAPESADPTTLTPIAIDPVGVKPGTVLFTIDATWPYKVDVEVVFAFVDFLEDPRNKIRLGIKLEFPRLIRAVRFVVAKAEETILLL